jgi:hypothetical protein
MTESVVPIQDCLMTFRRLETALPVMARRQGRNVAWACVEVIGESVTKSESVIRRIRQGWMCAYRLAPCLFGQSSMPVIREMCVGTSTVMDGLDHQRTNGISQQPAPRCRATGRATNQAKDEGKWGQSHDFISGNGQARRRPQSFTARQNYPRFLEWRVSYVRCTRGSTPFPQMVCEPQLPAHLPPRMLARQHKCYSRCYRRKKAGKMMQSVWASNPWVTQKDVLSGMTGSDAISGSRVGGNRPRVVRSSIRPTRGNHNFGTRSDLHDGVRNFSLGPGHQRQRNLRILGMPDAVGPVKDWHPDSPSHPGST